MFEKLKRKKYLIAASTIAFLLSLLICVSIFLPKNIGNVLTIPFPPVEQLTISQIESQHSCVLEKSGKYVITGGDPQIIFSCTKRQTECIKINIEKQTTENVNIEVFTAYEDGVFSPQRQYNVSVFKKESSAVVDLPAGEYSFIRIDIDTEGVYFKSIEVFDQQPQAVPFVPERKLGDYLKSLLIPAAIAWLIWKIEKYTHALQMALRAIKKNRFKIAQFIVFSIVAVLAAIMLEMIIGLILSRGGFNKYRCIFLSGIAELIYVFIFSKKNLAQKIENVFLPVALVVGLVMLFASPIVHASWDLDSHHPRAVGMSYMGTVYATGAEQELDVSGGSELIRLEKNAEGKIALPRDVYQARLARLEELDQTVVGERDAIFSISHLPSGIFMAVARTFDAGFATRYNLGRLANLLVYVFVCYFAIKKIKSGKMILVTISLFPTNLFMATNYAYDPWVIAFSMLGIAYYVNILQHPKRIIKTWDIIIMTGAFAVASLPKLVYIVMMAIPLFMLKEWSGKREKREYYTILSMVFAVVFAYFLFVSFSKLGGPGDIRGGNVNPQLQLDFILKNPIAYSKILGKFLFKYLSYKNMYGYISTFSYYGNGKLAFVFIALIAITALTDTNSKIKFKIPTIIRVCSVVLFIGVNALIATALYIDYTPFGSTEILGCQPRYITPLLAPLLLLVTGSRWNIVKNKKLYNGAILCVAAAVVMLESYSMIIKTMI